MSFSFFSKRSARRRRGVDSRKAERHETNMLSCHLGKVVNVSTTGMQLRCDGKPPVRVGQIIEAKLDAGHQRIPVQAQIVWIKRRGFKTFAMGMRFVNISRSLQAAIESLGMFGYIDLEAAAKARQQKSGGPVHGQHGPINATVELPDYYGLLGVSPDATPADIKKAFHAKARKHHPDIAKTKADAEMFVRCTEAYEVLYDAAKRKTYDLRRAC